MWGIGRPVTEQDAQQPPPLTDDEWRAIAREHARSYAATLAWLVPVILVAVAVLGGPFLEESARPQIVVHHLTLAALLVPVALVLRRRRLADFWALPSLAFFALLFGELMLWVGWHRPEARVDAMTFAVLIALGFVMLSLPWLVVTLAANVACIAVLTTVSPERDFDASLGIMMLTAALLSFGLHRMRVASIRKVEELQRLDRWRAEQLRAAKEAAEAASRAKSEFLANMSHEIRNPLSAVIGGASLLQDSEQSPEQRDLTNIIRRSSETLLALINDVLDFSKIESGRLELEEEEFDLLDCIESALDLVGGRAVEKGLDLAVQVDESVPPAVVGDATRLRQILVNLLGNAVKFTERGEVVLAVEARADGERSEVRFTVRDTGIGIAADRIEGVFEAYRQAEASTSRRFGGTGLGLAISKRLCESMGGEIGVESDGVAGRGATFTFHVNLAARPAADPAARERDGMRFAGKRLLIADANDATRRALAAQARVWGMTALEARDAASALEQCRAVAPDVAIVDAEQAGVGAAQLVEGLRSLCAGRAFAAVLMSSAGERRRLSGETGFAASLLKPVKPSTFHDALLQALSGPPARPAAERAPRPAVDRRPDGCAPLRILVAEDNPTNQHLTVQLLQRLGYPSDVAGNGLEALEALGRQRYDVVLMDMMMPEMDGLDATRAIRATRPAAEQPHIIAVTANAVGQAREQCLAAGMDDYMSKPVVMLDLAAALARAADSLQRRRAVDEGRGASDER
jgi:signal transduction histidine kinase/DNA-binding response OmpR family regulator